MTYTHVFHNRQRQKILNLVKIANRSDLPIPVEKTIFELHPISRKDLSSSKRLKLKLTGSFKRFYQPVRELVSGMTIGMTRKLSSRRGYINRKGIGAKASGTVKKAYHLSFSQKLGIFFMVFALGGLIAAAWPFLQLDLRQFRLNNILAFNKPVPSPTPKPEINPMIDANGEQITPVNTEFSLVVPSIGINAKVIPGVNPIKEYGYNQALLEGVAHSVISYYPDENGTVYLFSHSTNYEWFVKDLNAVFYLLKNVKTDDYVVVFYLGNRYTYKVRESKIVGASEIGYLQPQKGVRNLVLQTCWPPGTNYQRMLIFADFVEEKIYGKLGDIQ